MIWCNILQQIKRYSCLSCADCATESAIICAGNDPCCVQRRIVTSQQNNNSRADDSKCLLEPGRTSFGKILSYSKEAYFRGYVVLGNTVRGKYVRDSSDGDQSWSSSSACPPVHLTHQYLKWNLGDDMNTTVRPCIMSASHDASPFRRRQLALVSIPQSPVVCLCQTIS